MYLISHEISAIFQNNLQTTNCNVYSLEYAITYKNLDEQELHNSTMRHERWLFLKYIFYTTVYIKKNPTFYT